MGRAGLIVLERSKGSDLANKHDWHMQDDRASLFGKPGVVGDER